MRQQNSLKSLFCCIFRKEQSEIQTRIVGTRVKRANHRYTTHGQASSIHGWNKNILAHESCPYKQDALGYHKVESKDSALESV